MKQFAPVVYPLKYKIRDRLRGTANYDYNFNVRRNIPNIIDRIFAKLHYLGSHSYVVGKWHKIETKLLKHHPNRF